MNDSSSARFDDADMILDDEPTTGIAISFTLLTKLGGPLTKTISLSADGKLVSDGSACVMSAGHAVRKCMTLEAVAVLIDGLQHNQALALGQLRADLPDRVHIVTKASLGLDAPPDTVARTADYISYVPGEPALVLLDVDLKAMPEAVRQRVADLGGPVAAILSVLPELADTARIVRNSTSSCLIRSDTGIPVPGSAGAHVLMLVADGSDAERLLNTLHLKMVLAGLSWMMVGRRGQLLRRSLIDRSVYAGERLDFEAAPILTHPLVQDRAARAPVVYPGSPMDTREIVRDLSVVEQARVREIEAAERLRVSPDTERVRRGFVGEEAARIVAASDGKVTLAQAERQARLHINGTLLPSAVLQFDDEALGNKAVMDVLTDANRFVGETLADPHEGIPYGRCKAKIMRRADGSLWVHSFAHGLSVYDLKYDAAAVQAAIEAAPEAQAADILVGMLPFSEVDATAEDLLREMAVKRAQIKVSSLKSRIKEARREYASARAQEARHAREGQRKDVRVRLVAPRPDAPFLPVVAALDEVLSASPDPEPPMRDVEGNMAVILMRRVPTMHELTDLGSNAEEETDDTRLPAAETPLMTRLTVPELSELIERHIDFYVTAEEGDRSVHLPEVFISGDHYLVRRHDKALPQVTGIATLPIIMPDGRVMARNGLDRPSGVVYRIPPALLGILPDRDDCDDAAVKAAFRFLTQRWLVDVQTDMDGLCKALAACLTQIERMKLEERPCFLVAAGRRGSGKTTLLKMLLTAVTGIKPSAAAWSNSSEERRKALMSYLMDGVPFIVWDNIPRGTLLSCQHIEASCTAETMQDRVLGESKNVLTSAASIHYFTGNNIAPSGDLASRTLGITLQVERHDPENRPFEHSNIIDWTLRNRGRILSALYTLMMGNPMLRPGCNEPDKTRFKTWWHVIGSSIEHAAELVGHRIDFREQFLLQDANDQESAGLAEALQALLAWRPRGFLPGELAAFLNGTYEHDPVGAERCATLKEYFFPKHRRGEDISANSVRTKLPDQLNTPVPAGDRTLILKTEPDAHAKSNRYFVDDVKPKP